MPKLAALPQRVTRAIAEASAPKWAGPRERATQTPTVRATSQRVPFSKMSHAALRAMPGVRKAARRPESGKGARMD